MAIGSRCSTHLRSELFLLLAAAIWGFAFVAQKAAMDSMGPFSFTALRFGIGATCILPFAVREWRGGRKSADFPISLRCGTLLGVFLFLGMSLQQGGIVSTTAGNAGFITGLYAVFVPLFGVFFGHPLRISHFGAGLLAICGLYLLSVGDGLVFAYGDALVLCSAVIWAIHVLLISNFSARGFIFCIAAVQCYVCAALSLLVLPLAAESLTAGVAEAYLALGYAGCVSVAGGFAFQLMAQREAHPSYASIVLSLEAVFAAIGGYVFLGEQVSLRGMTGAGLMLTAIVVSSRGGKVIAQDTDAITSTPLKRTALKAG